MSAKKWFAIFIAEISVLIIGIASIVIFVDPYFHYHKPINTMFYTLDNQRSQNDGIIKQFDYDSIIIGTSMAENFKTSEFDEIFCGKSIKVCFSGGSYKEMNDNLQRAFNSGHEIKYVLRCLDYRSLMDDKDKMRSDLGEYPTYLYDQNFFNDVNYVLNKEIVFNVCIPMIVESYLHGKEGGVTSFDVYSNWNSRQTFGAKAVLGDRREYKKAKDNIAFSEEDSEIVRDTIKQNVTSLAGKHPETTFLLFFPPYSIAYWGEGYENGTLNQQIDAEKFAIELLLEYENIELYSFNDCWDIVTNLNNYKDHLHYGEWINTKMLHMIHDGVGRLTKDNYETYIERERNFYLNYTYQFFDIVDGGDM